jgi:hypothetical protein
MSTTKSPRKARRVRKPGKFTLSGDGLCIARDSGDNVSQEYTSPGTFTAGTIVGVAVYVGKVLGPGSGALKPDANVCLLGTLCATLMSVKYFDWDDAKNAKLRTERGIGFEDVVFQSSAATCSTSWSTRTPTVTPATTSSTDAAHPRRTLPGPQSHCPSPLSVREPPEQQNGPLGRRHYSRRHDRSTLSRSEDRCGGVVRGVDARRAAPPSRVRQHPRRQVTARSPA